MSLFFSLEKKREWQRKFCRRYVCLTYFFRISAKVFFFWMLILSPFFCHFSLDIYKVVSNYCCCFFFSNLQLQDKATLLTAERKKVSATLRVNKRALPCVMLVWIPLVKKIWYPMDVKNNGLQSLSALTVSCKLVGNITFRMTDSFPQPHHEWITTVSLPSKVVF